MAIPSRTDQPGTYFITSVTAQRKRIFQASNNAELFLETLQHYRREGHYLLHDFVVMPEHIHILLTPQKITLERAVGLIKGGFSHRMQSKFPVWQKGFTDHRVRDQQDFLEHRRYIRMNPVEARLVAKPEEYLYSSVSAELRRRTSAAEAASEGDCLRHG